MLFDGPTLLVLAVIFLATLIRSALKTVASSLISILDSWP
jgi:hypothetical protein